MSVGGRSSMSLLLLLLLQAAAMVPSLGRLRSQMHQNISRRHQLYFPSKIYSSFIWCSCNNSNCGH